MANELTFNFIFDSVIGAVERSAPAQAHADLFVRLLKESKAAMCRNYNDIKNDVKSKCMKFKDKYLDRHKCAAAFMIAVMNNLKIKENNLNKENVAITIGLIILQIIIRKENKNYNDCGMMNFIEKNGFQYPKCIRDDEPYEENWALGMHYDRLSGRLSMLSLSNTLFWVERYNRMLL
jgi:hypothetical protein